MSTSANQAGFTLAEIMVSLGLVSLVAVALLAVAQTQVRLHRTENSLQATEDNARAALEILAHDARLLGAPSRGWGLINTTGGPSPLLLYNVLDGDTGPDSLQIIVPTGELVALSADADPTVASLNLMRYDPQSQLNPATAPPAARDFSVGDYVLLSNITQVAAPPPPPSLPSPCMGPGAISAALLQVTGVASNSLSATLGPSLTALGCSFPRGSLVSRATATTYSLDPSQELVADDGAPVRGTPGTQKVLAEHIVDLQIAVGVDGLNGLPADGILTEGIGPNDDEWIFNFPGESLGTPVPVPSALRITIVARTAGTETTLGPGLPAIENRPAGPPDFYRYRVLTTTVVPRNLVQP